MVYGLASSLLDFFSGGIFIHVWRRLVGRCLLLGTKGCDCPLFLAKSYTHRNLEGHVEFGDLLVV